MTLRSAIEEAVYRIKMWLQRKFRGYSDNEIWNLDDAIVRFVLPRLKVFREQTMGYPVYMGSLEEWQSKLDEMIWAFEFLQSDESPYVELKEKYGDEKNEEGKFRYIEEYKKINKRYEDAMTMFGKYMHHLWF